ncbi:hypothetical protein H0H93_012298, partial [Arthromyces matolae]
SLIQRSYSWDTFTSPSKPPVDSGAVAVFDGTKILLTPFRVQNVPPPMSAAHITFSSTHRAPVHASFSADSDTLAVLWENGYVELWNLQTRLQGGRGKAMDPTNVWTGSVDNVKNARQIHWTSSSTLHILWTDYIADHVTSLQLEDNKVKGLATTSLPSINSRLVATTNPLASQIPSGEIYRLDSETQKMLPVANFQEFCLQSQAITEPSSEGEETIYVGLGRSGKLHISKDDAHHILATNVTSFTVASGFVIFNTTAHEAQFVPVSSLGPLLTSSHDTETKQEKTQWETRRVERGSRIVVAVPSAMSLVLQMPRGNLETINPRPLVMEVVKQDINA